MASLARHIYTNWGFSYLSAPAVVTQSPITGVSIFYPEIIHLISGFLGTCFFRSIPSLMASMTNQDLSIPHRAMSESGKDLSISYRAMSESGKDLSIPHRAMSESGKDLSISYRAMSESGKDLSISYQAMSESGKDLSMSYQAMSMFNRNFKIRFTKVNRPCFAPYCTWQDALPTFLAIEVGTKVSRLSYLQMDFLCNHRNLYISRQ
jgi:hypothetical protein